MHSRNHLTFPVPGRDPVRACPKSIAKRGSRQAGMTKYMFLFAHSLISIAFFFSTASATQGESQPEASPAFTNKDLEQYRPSAPAGENPAQGADGALKGQKPDRRQKSEAIAERKEQEYWCKKARQVKKSLAIAKDEVDELTARLKDLSSAGTQITRKKTTSLEKQQSKTSRELKTAGKRLRERQETLAELEGDAYRSNIPAGWLRCQFE